MKKKIVALCLCLTLAVMAVAGASLAYFTDAKKEDNTFTVGNVKIDLLESQLHRSNASGNPDLATPSMANKMVPADDYAAQHGWKNAYYSDEVIKADAATYKENYFNPLATNLVPGRNIHKMPYVVNTGDNAAYVRVRVMIPVQLFKMIDDGPSYWTTTALKVGDVKSEAVDLYYAKGFEAVPTETRDGVDYYVYDFTYQNELKPGEMTFWNCWGTIRIAPNTTQEELAGVESFHVLVEADAIQSEGFDTAAEAFAAFDK